MNKRRHRAPKTESKRQEPAFRVSPLKNEGQERRFGILIHAIKSLLEPFRPYDVAMEAKGLSEALSRSRGSTVRQEYLNNDLTQAAYCAHFLPWNIYRLLLAWSSSPPAILTMKKDRENLIVDDWGAGPMVGLLALWVAGGPEALEGVTYRAIEKQRAILNWGERLVKKIGLDEMANVEAHIHRLDFDDAHSGDCDLLIVSNAFNEWLPPRGRSTDEIRSFATVVDTHLSDRGELSLMEPATRVVSWGVMVLRDVLIERGMSILAPCTHANACPLLKRDLKSWCHFRLPIEVHPYHRSLADKIRIDRDSVAYSYLHVTKSVVKANPPERASFARVISDPISVESGRAVYACASKGRVQLETRARHWSQGLQVALAQDEKIAFRFPQKIKKDAKSWAPRIPLEKVRRSDGTRLDSSNQNDR